MSHNSTSVESFVKKRELGLFRCLACIMDPGAFADLKKRV